MPRQYRYCPHCATPFIDQELHGHRRQVCPTCGFIFWQNPVVGVAVIVTDGECLILGRRARGVYRGAWCIPCGYVEYDEDVRQAARREFHEETGLLVQVGEVYTVHSNFYNPAMHSVGIWFCGTVLGGTLRPADDLDAVAYVSLRRLPANLAFPTDRLVLAQLRRDYESAVRQKGVGEHYGQRPYQVRSDAGKILYLRPFGVRYYPAGTAAPGGATRFYARGGWHSRRWQSPPAGSA